jgi:protoporphyrinogen oxidase
VSNERLDKITAERWLKKYAGSSAYKVLWQPLLEGKFSRFAGEVPAAWLKDRVRDRSFKLGYLAEGTKTLFDELQRKIIKQGNTILHNCEVLEIQEIGERVVVQTESKKYKFDVCLMTSISPIATKLISSPLKDTVRKNLEEQDQIGAVCVTLELTHSIQPFYWVNICDLKSNVLVMVEHTNLIDKKQYDNHHIVYLANYIHRSEKRFQQSDEEIIEEYSQILKKLNSAYDPSWIIKAHVSRAPRAQTIFSRGALHNRPPKQLSPRIYLGNIDQMYPHDRNLNLGVELAHQLSSQIDANELL